MELTLGAVIFFTIICGLLGILHQVTTDKRKKFWTTQGITPIPSSTSGHTLSNLFKGVNLFEIDLKVYNFLKSKSLTYAGLFQNGVQTLVISDLELYKTIFVKDFDYFVDRREFSIVNCDSVAGRMLFFQNGDAWKELRAKSSPTYTTGKIRRMFGMMDESGQRLVDFLKNEINNVESVDFVQAYGKYSLDCISSTSFGIESGAFRDKESVFETMAHKLRVNFNPLTLLKFAVMFCSPKIASLMGLTVFSSQAYEYFTGIIMKTIMHRRSRSVVGEKRDDFLQLMLEARVEQLKYEETNQTPSSSGIIWTDEMICAQSIQMIVAGFDTTQSLLHFSAYQLAISEDVQEKLAKEVISSYDAHGGKFTYESINEMEYLDKFINEVLRMYPPVPRLERKCTKDYKIPGTDSIIKENTLVVIPAYGIHHDPNFFPEPERFDPERFSKEGKLTRHPHAFMPFGQGPRNCIGMRFAYLESKLAIAHLVLTFKFFPSKKMKSQIKFALTTTLKIEGGIWVDLQLREDSEIDY